MPTPKAYLDTCIVSGLAKEDLSTADATSILRILEGRKAGAVDLVTSDIAKREIEKIPEAYRARHAVIYNLLADVPVAPTHRTNSGLLLMGVGGGTREDPLFTELKKCFPTQGTLSTFSRPRRTGLRFSSRSTDDS